MRIWKGVFREPTREDKVQDLWKYLVLYQLILSKCQLHQPATEIHHHYLPFRRREVHWIEKLKSYGVLDEERASLHPCLARRDEYCLRYCLLIATLDDGRLINGLHVSWLLHSAEFGSGCPPGTQSWWLLRAFYLHTHWLQAGWILLIVSGRILLRRQSCPGIGKVMTAKKN